MTDSEMEITKYMQKFDKAIEEMRALKFRKTQDYGLACEKSLGCKGLYVDLNGKTQRLKRLVWEGREAKVKDETIRDTYLDLAIYALMGLLAYDEKNMDGDLK